MGINKQDITIFVVDDEFAIRDSLTLLIESIGLKVKSYESAATFLEHYNPEQPACMLLDIRIPYIGGLELQEELLKRNNKIPIIFISGHADIPLSSKAFRNGAVDVIEKPFDNEHLLQRINEAVDKLLITWNEVQKKRQILERYAQLTEREKEVFMLIVHNHSNKQAAKIMGISNRTVDVHRAHLMEKMQADSLNTLTIMAMLMKIL